MILIQNDYKTWNEINTPLVQCHFAGCRDFAQKACNILSDNTENFEGSIKHHLMNLENYTSGVIETNNQIIAWVDHIRSTPVFFSVQHNQICISDNAHKLKNHFSLETIDASADLEFSMAGYATGGKTLFKDLFTLQPGQFLIWDKTAMTMKVISYFQYVPTLSGQADIKKNIVILNKIIDSHIKRIIDDAKGKTIWVPLSAGLDSRIILCKLHEFGATNVQTFTYGPKYNFEALHAKRIAKTLNIPWRMITITNKDAYALFNSQARKDFWRFADGLKSIPCMREFSAIYYLKSQNIAKQGDIFVNGQSGDYITGGHIPDTWCEKNASINKSEFLNVLVDKHYDLWFDLKTEENIEQVHDQIQSLIAEELPEQSTGEEWAKLHEFWEYQGRQICYVVNGQRVYEFFGFYWRMPLWEKELVDFCATLPIKQKRDQYLYKEYLKQYNYKGLFPTKESYIWRWPITSLWVVVIAQIVGKLKGKDAKRLFYARMRNKGHYANQYAFFTKDMHNKTYDKCRSIISLYIPIWQKENIPDTNYESVNLTKISS